MALTLGADEHCERVEAKFVQKCEFDNYANKGDDESDFITNICCVEGEREATEACLEVKMATSDGEILYRKG